MAVGEKSWMLSLVQRVTSILGHELQLAFSSRRRNTDLMLPLSGLNTLSGNPWWEQQFRAVSHPRLCGLHLHTWKRNSESTVCPGRHHAVSLLFPWGPSLWVPLPNPGEHLPGLSLKNELIEKSPRSVLQGDFWRDKLRDTQPRI